MTPLVLDDCSLEYGIFIEGTDRQVAGCRQ